MIAGVIGCGRMGAFTSEGVRRFAPPCWFPLSHVEAIRAHPSLTLAAVADSDERSWRRAAEAHGIEKGFTDFRELLAQVKPRLLGIATRTPGRAQIIADGAAAGVRAFHVEKPLCGSRRELDALIALFAHGEYFLTLGAIRRHFSVYREARALAASGTYGALRELRVNMGAGALYWTHPHSVDLLLFGAGERRLEAVQARLSDLVFGESNSVVASDPIIDAASLHFDDGVIGHITRAPGADLAFACANAEIIVENDGRAIRIRELRGDDPYPASREHAVPAAPGPEGSFAAIAQLVGCLEGRTDALAENQRLRADILLGQRVLFAMVESHLRQSRLLPLAESDADITVLARTGNNFA